MGESPAIIESGSGFSEIGVERNRLIMRMDRLARNLRHALNYGVMLRESQHISRDGITPCLASRTPLYHGYVVLKLRWLCT